MGEENKKACEVHISQAFFIGASVFAHKYLPTEGDRIVGFRSLTQSPTTGFCLVNSAFP